MGSIGAQKATNAKTIENMNEAQLDKEISKTQKAIDRANKTLGVNDITNTAEARAMQNAFPLGVGGDGWTDQARRRRNKQLERDVRKAVDFTEAVKARDAAQARLQRLEDAKKQIAGTGKTLKQIQDEKVKETVKNTASTLKWQTTQKGGFTKTGAYQPKVIKAGNIEIHGSDGLYTIYKDGKVVGSTDKLSKAKAVAERIK